METTKVTYKDTDSIKKLLVGRSVMLAKNTTLTLDDGTRLNIVPNEGCWGCTEGNYWLENINDCPNIITDVKFKESEVVDGSFTNDVYEVFVYAENQQINLYTVKGHDNGYYGSGYTITVQFANN